MLDKGQGRRVLMDLVHYRTYAAVKPNGRKESRSEVVDRVKKMHQTKFPWLADEIEGAFAETYEGLTVPSMRSMQFGGVPVFRSNARVFNCAYAPLTRWADFADLFWLLLNGVGTGYSIQSHHVSKLPIVTSPSSILRIEHTFEIPDSKEGWADAIKELLHDCRTKFKYHLVRPKGAPLSTGGYASGPESLATAIENIRHILRNAFGRQLRPVECFDIMNHLADIVVVGSVRRAATNALFDAGDDEMLNAKQGEWWREHPHRARANISAVIHRRDPEANAKIRNTLKSTFDSGCGEPGVFLTNDLDHGTNPCFEIALKPYGLCNLTEINVAACTDESDFLRSVESATAIGTLQATYTNFAYLQPEWQKNAEDEALLGVSMTGQAMNWKLLTPALLEKGAALAKDVNARWAEKLGINPAARITTTKPSGSTSAWWGTTSGIHAAHSPYILRRVRIDRKDEFGKFLMEKYGVGVPNSYSFIEEDEFNAENIILTVPIAFGEDAILREEETALELLERTKHIYVNWVKNGHQEGPNTHNVSLTLTYHNYEKDAITDWMVHNQANWAGIALLPFDGGSYRQAPFEAVDAETYHSWLGRIPNLDFGEIDFTGHHDLRTQDFACSGSASCEII